MRTLQEKSRLNHNLTAFVPKFKAESIFSEGLAHISMDGKRHSYCEKQGNVVITPQFELAGDFQYCRARIVKGGKEGFIDDQGKIVVLPIYDQVRDFRGQLASVKIHGKFGYVNQNGEVVWKPSR